MTWGEFTELMTNFRTDNIMRQLEAWSIADLSSNPWFLGGMGALIIVTYLLGKQAIAACIIGIGGFAMALSWTVAQGTGTEGLAGSGIYILIGGGTVAIGLFIYLLFIKSD